MCGARANPTFEVLRQSALDFVELALAASPSPRSFAVVKGRGVLAAMTMSVNRNLAVDAVHYALCRPGVDPF